MSAAETSPSEGIRSKLDHPVVDCDGHYIEFMPYFMDFVEDVGGTHGTMLLKFAMAQGLSNDVGPRADRARARGLAKARPESMLLALRKRIRGGDDRW